MLKTKPDFTYQVGVIRAIESRLLTKPQLERMLSAPDAESALKVLNDLDWSQFLDRASKPSEFQAVLNAGLLSVKDFLNSMLEDRQYFDFLWLLFDLQNCKIATKSLVKQEDPKETRKLLTYLGTITPDQLLNHLANQESQVVYPWLSEVIQKAQEEYAKTENPETIEIVLNNYFFEQINLRLKKVKSKMIQEFFSRLIDLENIKFFLRRRLRDQQEIQVEELISGGLIKSEVFLEILSLNELLPKIKDNRFYLFVKEELLTIDQSNFIKIESAIDHYLFKILFPSKLEPFGPEAVFAYFWTKKRNAEIIRAVMVGKLNHLEVNQIRSWVKDPSLELF
jgi:V/A-type H+-transporting ATPase subunit C